MFKWGGGVTEESLLKQFKRRVGKGINCLQEGGDYESVTIPVCTPNKNFVIVHWVVLSECWVIIFGVRFDIIAFWWFLMELFWVCSGPFGIVWSGSI